jgi:hypothetical protein
LKKKKIPLNFKSGKLRLLGILGFGFESFHIGWKPDNFWSSVGYFKAPEFQRTEITQESTEKGIFI